MKIIVLSTFPCEANHGGGIRLRNIVKEYKRLGHEVVSAGVLGSSSYNPVEYFIEYPANDIKRFPPAMEDYAIGEVLNESANYDKLIGLFPWVPDVIHVECPWLFKFAERYVRRSKGRIHLIYGSQNIEYQLKFPIYSQFQTLTEAKKNAEVIKDVELHAVRNADACFAVSEHDKNFLEKYTDKPVVLIPNGVSPRETNNVGEEALNRLHLPEKYVLYCASAHMPNVTGLYEIFESGLGCIEPDQKLVIVGGSCHLIQRDSRFAKIPCFNKRILFLGEVSEDLLASLLDKAHCIILPITAGGGTNLKTAEAIWTGAHVVGTQTAFRGFEQYKDIEGITIATSPQEFRQAVNASLIKNRNDSSKTRKQRSKVLWQECLTGLSSCLEYLLERKHGDNEHLA